MVIGYRLWVIEAGGRDAEYCVSTSCVLRHPFELPNPFLIFFTGFVCIMMVVLSALSAEIRHENNELISANEELSGEVETISVKIKSINSVEHIEKVAKDELGMVYPDSEQCVVITEKDAPGENFAAAIKKQAYN